MLLSVYLDSVITRYFEDLPDYINLERFYKSQRGILLEVITEQKQRGRSRKNLSLGSLFLLPLVSGVVDNGASDILNYCEDETNEEFFITVPEDIWNQIGK